MLDWQLKSAAQGQHRAALEHLRKTKGLAVPALENEPPVHPANTWLWLAFCVLTEKRQRGFDGHPQPIPVSEIGALAAYEGIFLDDQRSLFFYVISALDSHYMRHHWDEYKKRQAAEDAKRARQRR